MEKMRGKSFLFVLVSLVLLFAMVGGTWTTAAAAKEQMCSCNIPTISILSVKPDESVTIKTANYPANDTFKVYMNYYGTRGLHGIEVDSINSGSGGAFEKTFTIPISKYPKLIQLIVIPFWAFSTAIAFVNPSNPAFDAA